MHFCCLAFLLPREREHPYLSEKTNLGKKMDLINRTSAQISPHLFAGVLPNKEMEGHVRRETRRPRTSHGQVKSAGIETPIGFRTSQAQTTTGCIICCLGQGRLTAWRRERYLVFKFSTALGRRMNLALHLAAECSRKAKSL